MENLVFVLVGLAVFGLFIVRPVWQSIRGRRESAGLEESAEKAEAFFQASFPELQPLFHPQAVAEYVVKRQHRQFADRERWAATPERLVSDPFRITVLAPHSVASTWRREALPGIHAARRGTLKRGWPGQARP